MKNFLNFKVHPRLADLLGEEYKSSERALKELVDNAWDADADNVYIVLPQKLGEDVIAVKDDGTGMTDEDLSAEYLNIARNRILNGERTSKNRKIKGRRGVGKFAGLTIANTMTLDTKKDGYNAVLIINKSAIIQQDSDIEDIELPIKKTTCPVSEKGTNVILTELNQHLALPDPEKLKGLLSLDYGREIGFNIFINGESLTLQHYPGQFKDFNYDIPGVGHVKFRLNILNSPNRKNSGAFFRLNNKIIDEKDFLGLDEMEEFSDDIRHRFIGEVDIESQDETLSGNSGFLNTSSKAFRKIKKALHDTVVKQLKEVVSSESDTRITGFISKVDNRVAELTPSRKIFFNATLKKLFFRFHKMTRTNMHFLISLILDALEHSNEKD